jgi:hypothetical protein
MSDEKWIVYDATISNPSYNSATSRKQAEEIAKERASSMRRAMCIARVFAIVKETVPPVFEVVDLSTGAQP